MRRLAWFAAGFVSGLFLAQAFLSGGALLGAGFFGLALAAAALAAPWAFRRRLALLLAGLALSCGWQWLYVRQVQRPMEALAGTTQAVELTLCGAPEAHRYGAKAEARMAGLPGKVMYYGDASLLEQRPGNTVTATVALQSASRIRDTDVNVFTAKGIFLLAYGKGGAVYGPGSAGSLRWLPQRLRASAQSLTGTLFQGDAAALMRALLTGDPSRLSVQARGDLSEAGLYHVLAVSGMHYAYLLLLVGFLFGPYRSVAAVPVLALFALTVGGSPSVVRACVMLSLFCAAPLLHRESDPPTALAAAALCILLHNPFAVQAISFQLSFGAVIGLLWLTPGVKRLLAGEVPHGKAVTFLIDSVSATTGALACTAPLTALYFGRFVPVGFLSNLLCLWLVGAVFLAGLLAVCAGALWLPLGKAAALIPQLLAGLLLRLAHALAALPGHAVYFVDPYLKYWLVFLPLLFLLARRSRGRRAYAAAVLAAVLTLSGAVSLNRSRYTAPLDALVLDVGQGESVLLKSGRAFALIDCGSANSWYDPGGTAADWLLTLGGRRLDALLLTHFDSDHINGVETLLARVGVERLLVPGRNAELEALAARYGTAYICVESEEVLTLGTAVLQVFPPLGREDDNERGLSLLAAANGETLFIPGDMSAKTEQTLTGRYDLPHLTALAAGHHGSKNSTSGQFLERTSPDTVCISVGANAYGHPAPETLRRLAEHGCAVYRTDLHGTIHLALGADRHGI